MQEVEQQIVIIKSNPDKALFYIDDKEVGRSNNQLFLYPGQYRLKLIMSKYETIDEIITVTEDGNNTFSYTLIKTKKTLTIRTTPSNAEVYLNSEKITSRTLEVPPGNYKIEVKKDGYFSEMRTITVEKGKDLTETFRLKQKTGRLQVGVEPMETRIGLKQGNRERKSWTGSKTIMDLAIGDYTLICFLEGYKSQKKNIKITLDTIASVEIMMFKIEVEISDLEVLLPSPEGFVQYEKAPEMVKYVQPEYPGMAQKARIESEVWVKVLIDKEGKVSEVLLLEDPKTNAGFWEAAGESAWETVWKPAILNGKPIAVWLSYKYTFKLD